ncbi:MAG: transketolase family protein [Patescibacteria group bacterium]|nr:transketolase family protein [Patescibacteria group bacterium]
MMNDKIQIINMHINPKIFDKDVEQAPIRKGFGDGLLKAAEIDGRIVGLCADLTDSTHMNTFKQKFPERFVEMGVAEQNLVSVASGMAAMGKIPFVSSYAVFSPGRNWEQIRTTVCYNNVPVKIAGSHAGVSVGPDGGSHQALEDIAITRVLPRMAVISPCDAIEARKATIAAAKTDSPTYIRLAREKTPIITVDASPFEIGKAYTLFRADHSGQKVKADEGHRSVAIIATGSLVYRAMLAGKKLIHEGYEVEVINLHTIKPIDEKAIVAAARKYKAIVTVEEHQIIGGMGSAVAEVLARNYPVPIEFVGVQDMFGQSGTPDELIVHYGMDEKSIYNAARRVMLRR